MIVWAVVCWQDGADPPRIWQRYPQPGSIRPLCHDGSPARETMLPRESLNSQWTDARVMLYPPAMSFQRKSGPGMDWDLIIGAGWGIHGAAGERERRKRGGVRKPKLSANVKFSVTIQLFAPLGRCDSEFDVKRSVLSGASGRRSFRGSACLHLPLRQIQRCRDLNPARPGCSNFLLLGHFS